MIVYLIDIVVVEYDCSFFLGFFINYCIYILLWILIIFIEDEVVVISYVESLGLNI